MPLLAVDPGNLSLKLKQEPAKSVRAWLIAYMLIDGFVINSPQPKHAGYNFSFLSSRILVFVFVLQQTARCAIAAMANYDDHVMMMDEGWRMMREVRATVQRL